MKALSKSGFRGRVGPSKYRETFIGTATKVNTEILRFSSFAECVAQSLLQDVESLIFITDDGHEVVEDNFAEFISHLSMLFVYNIKYLEGPDTFGEKFELPNVPDGIEAVPSLPAAGSSLLSMDEQIVCLERRLSALAQTLKVSV
jgi:hypothetical protein